MCVGITGVGKTATIHSLLGLPPPASAGFAPETKQVGMCTDWSFGHLDGICSIRCGRVANTSLCLPMGIPP